MKKQCCSEGRTSRPSVYFKKSIPIIALFFIALIYYLIFDNYRIGIPCMFRFVSGKIFGIELLCPGCGITKLIVAESHLHLKEAFGYNPIIFILQPLLIYEILKLLINYYRGRQSRYGRVENAVLIIAIVALVIFGIWRNVDMYLL